MRPAMKTTMFLAVGAMAGLSSFAVAQDKMGSGKMDKMGKSSTLSAADKTFARKAAQGGIAEVKFGELASKQGTKADVKSFGQRMVDDHSKANDDLKQVASTKGVTLPADMNTQMKSEYAALAKLHGAAFDTKYIKLMHDDHKEDIADFQKEARNGKDADIKGFVSKTLPVIKEHYQMITGMSSGKSGGGGKMAPKMGKMGKTGQM